MNSRPSTRTNEATQITKKSRSNLAFAFISLPKEKRKDITTFYAFCRQVDDAADDPGVPIEERRRWLTGWRRWLVEAEPGEPAFAADVRRIIEKYRIDRQLFEEILLGVETDLEPVRFKDFQALASYCYRVASAVGLVSIEIFGYRNEKCKEYARCLGMALQLTNIIRDVNKDLGNGGRVYLPLSEMGMFGYSEADLYKQVYDRRFVQLMQFQAERAHAFFRQARYVLPNEDRKAMVAAEGMRAIYLKLLQRMEKDGFKVFEKVYRVDRIQKGLIVLAHMAQSRLGRV
jgi:15-cis-phytoene synthase